MKTLIIIDVQNDFIPGGALAVPGGDEIVEVINRLQEKFELIIATQDWHPQGHSSFAESHPGKKEFEKIQWKGQEQVLWPVHCVQETIGANFHPNLEMSRVEAIFRKGTNPDIDSYSGFYDNAHLKSTGLGGYLKEKGSTEIYFCGLAAEYCVYFSILDALQEGFETILIEDATRALDEEDFENAKKNILAKGGKIVMSKDL
ncbi:bifunctional nicotinamidase/pyrazinamidase [Antarcticibacterium flavum]|uniref:Nicotinamidase n=1 Tax=Antarcticibacterium flavum TaxID=2058175 RepID=A0A5B7X4C6_9FLAO|nr:MULTISPECIES: bifunctional nicotinamidase/pyrazinamidase [Antarcticibacterium]MCM4159060.1 bifunctional nicotinamidase/pyrazinamidase [Antarcticibacterium sp. W02-3]QCY69463.1 bifunctional nicotinamidase/pyrazinamidase [Antarcticibacterium flavum]